MKKKILFILFLLAIFTSSYGGNIVLVSAAGYKKPIQEIANLYETEHRAELDMMFGNMSQVINYVKNASSIDFVVGDRKFLDKSGIKFQNYKILGKGVLAIAYRKGLEMSSSEDILNGDIKKILVPDAKKAIYGAAAMEYLNKKNYYEQLKDKLMFVQTVPQVSSYLITGEADVGFINLTDALALKDKIGGYILVDEKDYSDIVISLGVIENKSASVNEFLEFLKKDNVQGILKKYGIGQ